MPDFLVRGIDNALAERIKTIARDRNWSINDVILHLVRQSLGENVESLVPSVERHDIAHLGGTWAPDESAAFRAAIEAFEGLPVNDTESGSTATRPKR